MKLAALFSGGKDSTYSAYLAGKGGHDVSIFACIRPARMDSYMFHGVNIDMVPLSAEAQGKPLVLAPSSGEKEKEVEDLKRLIELLHIDGVVSGAIASSYQRDRVNAVCRALGIAHVSPLWGKSPVEVLTNEIKSGMEIVMTHVAAAGLDRSWLGRRIDVRAAEELEKLSKRYGLSICGEGGEYETLVVDAPWFTKRIDPTKTEVIWEGTSGTLKIHEARLASK
jgi:diphthine-ammonia ligase